MVSAQCSLQVIEMIELFHANQLWRSIEAQNAVHKNTRHDDASSRAQVVGAELADGQYFVGNVTQHIESDRRDRDIGTWRNSDGI